MSNFNALPHSPFAPIDRSVARYEMLFGNAYPETYTDWKQEVMSWKTTAYLTAALNPTFTYRISGPDALRLLTEHSVNSFAKFSVGAAKHAIMCNDAGLIMAHGIVVRESEDSFITYWLMPWIAYLAESGRYKVKGENLTGKFFLFQVAGPRSLEILEAACGDNLHDIKFLRRRGSRIGGADVAVGSSEVDVLRVGMAGSLAYEVHGPIEKAHEVYNAILKAGEAFGLKQLGRAQYRMNHTENGFPQGHVHFMYPWFEDQGLAQWMMAQPGAGHFKSALRGSAGEDRSLRYRNPVELGWGHVIKFDHEFQGRAALEREVANPRRKVATLNWNAEDVLDIYRSHFEEGQEYPFIDFRVELAALANPASHFTDLVRKDGKTVGLSSGRTYSYRYRKMISLATIDAGESGIGNEVTVLWGDPGTRQKEVRATIDRYPLYDENRNEKLDVSAIPQGGI